MQRKRPVSIQEIRFVFLHRENCWHSSAKIVAYSVILWSYLPTTSALKMLARHHAVIEIDWDAFKTFIILLLRLLDIMMFQEQQLVDIYHSTTQLMAIIENKTYAYSSSCRREQPVTVHSISNSKRENEIERGILYRNQSWKYKKDHHPIHFQRCFPPFPHQVIHIYSMIPLIVVYEEWRIRIPFFPSPTPPLRKKCPQKTSQKKTLLTIHSFQVLVSSVFIVWRQSTSFLPRTSTQQAYISVYSRQNCLRVRTPQAGACTKTSTPKHFNWVHITAERTDMHTRYNVYTHSHLETTHTVLLMTCCLAGSAAASCCWSVVGTLLLPSTRM